MNLEKRLHKIETSLTPKQAVLAWLEEILELGFLGHTEKLFTGPRNEAPRRRIGEMVTNAVRKNLSQQGINPDMFPRIVRDAQMQSDFLIVLVTNLHSCIYSTCFHNWTSVLLLYEKFQRMIEQFVFQQKFRRKPWDLWRAFLVKTLLGMYQLRETVAIISATYYDHHRLLFAEQETELNEQIKSLETLIARYNQLAKGKPRFARIDLAKHSSALNKRVAFEVAQYVAIAKSKTLEDFGEDDAAWKITEPYAFAALETIRSQYGLKEATS